MAATVTVFVDDAVRGSLPDVCARTGVPTTKRLTIHEDLSGGLGAAWVLVFFGPLGWLVLALVAMSRRRSTLTVRIPYGAEPLGQYVLTARRTVHLAIGTGVVVVALLAAAFGLATSHSSMLFAAALVSLGIGGLVVIGNGLLARRQLVGIDLDASGRWVTLSRVHPAFAAACVDAPAAEPAARPGSAPVDQA